MWDPNGSCRHACWAFILAESLEQIRSKADVVRAAGCKIAVDDFGVGCSSLNYIHMLAPDMIKIDRCFVEMPRNVAAGSWTRTNDLSRGWGRQFVGAIDWWLLQCGTRL